MTGTRRRGYSDTERESISADGAALSDDEVMALNPQQLAADPELTARWLRIAESTHNAQMQDVNRIRAEMNDIANRMVLVSRINESHKLSANSRRTEAEEMRQYLDAQHAAKRARAEAARKFVSAGTNVKDVTDALRVESKLDTALRTRPNARKLVQRQA